MLNQQETPLLYSLVFGEGVVNDATSVVLFHAIQKFDLSHNTSTLAVEFVGYFLYLFVTSTLLGVAVSLFSSLSSPLLPLSVHIIHLRQESIFYLDLALISELNGLRLENFVGKGFEGHLDDAVRTLGKN